jgi:hypothetical protein
MRTAAAFAAIALAVSSRALATPACVDPSDLGLWVRSMIDQAHYVFVGRVTAVIARSADASSQVAVFEVVTPLKGSVFFERVGNAQAATSFHPLVGELRVFFVDGHRTLVDCSDYPRDLSEPVLGEVERELRGSRT